MIVIRPPIGCYREGEGEGRGEEEGRRRGVEGDGRGGGAEGEGEERGRGRRGGGGGEGRGGEERRGRKGRGRRGGGGGEGEGGEGRGKGGGGEGDGEGRGGGWRGERRGRGGRGNKSTPSMRWLVQLTSSLVAACTAGPRALLLDWLLANIRGRSSKSDRNIYTKEKCLGWSAPDVHKPEAYLFVVPQIDQERIRTR